MQRTEWIEAMATAEADVYTNCIYCGARNRLQAGEIDSARCGSCMAPLADTLYTLFEVTPDVTPEQLKRAYRRQILIWHPDKRRGEKTAEADFQRLLRAYQILSNPVTRGRYDESLAPLGKPAIHASAQASTSASWTPRNEQSKTQKQPSSSRSWTSTSASFSSPSFSSPSASDSKPPKARPRPLSLQTTLATLGAGVALFALWIALNSMGRHDVRWMLWSAGVLGVAGCIRFALHVAEDSLRLGGPS